MTREEFMEQLQSSTFEAGNEIRRANKTLVQLPKNSIKAGKVTAIKADVRGQK